MSQSLQSKTGVDEPVTVIKNYTVPAEEAEYFVGVYRENARIMSTHPGVIHSRLHRVLADAPEVRFVDIAEWGSGTALNEATADPERGTLGHKGLGSVSGYTKISDARKREACEQLQQRGL